jgi:hypothetical protein
MQLKTAKEYVALGVVRGFRAERVPMGKGWQLVVVGRGIHEEWILQTALNETRVFASLDTLVSTVEGITGSVVGRVDLTV